MTAASTEPFRYLLRVRYGECDAQGIVYNARWADYVDIAAGEYTRAIFASITGIDLKLVKLSIEWRASARFDDVLDIRVRTSRVGTTSFETVTELYRFGDAVLLATATTVYVVVGPDGAKRAVTEVERAKLTTGAAGAVIDHAATR